MTQDVAGKIQAADVDGVGAFPSGGHPTGDLEIVHVFLYEQINQPDVAQKTWAPELGDYRRMEMPPPAPPAE